MIGQSLKNVKMFFCCFYYWIFVTYAVFISQNASNLSAAAKGHSKAPLFWPGQIHSDPLASRFRSGRRISSHSIFADLFQELLSCDINSLVLFTDTDPDLQSDLLLLRTIASAGFLFTHYDISAYDDDEIRQMVRKGYVEHGVIDFIIMTRRSSDLVITAEKVFHEECRDSAALMAHRTKWTVIVWSESEMSVLVKSLWKSVFDNVALWLYNGSDDAATVHVWTLSWSHQRIRKADVVPTGTLGMRCDSFPNIAGGFNGRHLKGVGKLSMHPLYLHKKKDPATNTTVVDGAIVDVLNLLAESLNFSYTVSMTNASWDNFSMIVGERGGDVGLALWYPAEQYLSMDSSFPFVFGSVRGYYMVEQEGEKAYGPISTTTLIPYPAVVTVLLVCASIFSVIFYSLLERASEACTCDIALQWEPVPGQHGDVFKLETVPGQPRDPLKPELVHGQFCDRFEPESVPGRLCDPFKPGSVSLQSSGSLEPEPVPGQPCNPSEQVPIPGQRGNPSSMIQKLVKSIYRVYWQLMPTMINQGYLPSPRHMAPRAFLWTWGLFAVCFTAVYTGHLTSVRVRPREGLTIQSFNQLVGMSGYSWGVLNSSSVYGIMKTSKLSTLHDLGQKAILIPNDLPHNDMVSRMVSKMKGNFVLIFHDILAIGLAEKVGPPYQLKRIKEHLFQTQHGLALPKNSELNVMFSRKIQRFLDTRIVPQMFEKRCFCLDFGWYAPNDTRSLAVKSRSVHLSEMLSVLIFTLSYTGLAALVLICECMIGYKKTN